MRVNPETLVRDFYSNKSLKKFKKGEIILMPDPSKLPLITYVQEGIVQQYDITPEGEKTVVNLYKPGSFFPASSSINHTFNTYYFEALDDVKARQAKPEEVESLLLANPVVAYDLLKRLYRGVDGILQKLSSAVALTANQRIVNELIIHGERFGTEQPGASVVISITAGRIAQQTGLARETVSRELRKLKDQGLLSMKRGEIILLKKYKNHAQSIINAKTAPLYKH